MAKHLYLEARLACECADGGAMSELGASLLQLQVVKSHPLGSASYKRSPDPLYCGFRCPTLVPGQEATRRGFQSYRPPHDWYRVVRAESYEGRRASLPATCVRFVKGSVDPRGNLETCLPRCTRPACIILFRIH